MLCQTLKNVDGTAANGLEANDVSAKVAPKAESYMPTSKVMAFCCA